MSCMVLKKESIKSLALFISSTWGVNKQLYLGGDNVRLDVSEYLDKKIDFIHTEKLYNALYLLNVRAYNGRYNEEGEDFEPMPESNSNVIVVEAPIYDYNNNHWDYNKKQFVAIYKLLEGYIYQVSEDTTCREDLYKSLVEFRSNLNRFIIHNMEEYVNSSWC